MNYYAWITTFPGMVTGRVVAHYQEDDVEENLDEGQVVGHPGGRLEGSPVAVRYGAAGRVASLHDHVEGERFRQFRHQARCVDQVLFVYWKEPEWKLFPSSRLCHVAISENLWQRQGEERERVKVLWQPLPGSGVLLLHNLLQFCQGNLFLCLVESIY